jgi:hypothetical protein
MKRHIPTSISIALLIILLLPLSAEAQYFGRNKVLWEQFDFRVMKTDHFDIYYYDGMEEAVEDAARMAERWYDRLSEAFDHHFDRKPIIFYADHPDFQQTTTTGGLISEGTGGFTDFFKNRIVMPLTGSYADTDHVLGHEMVHVFQFDIAQRLTSSRQGAFQLQRLPLWMIEGLAEYLSQGRVDAQTAMWMRDAALHGNMPDFNRLSRDLRFSPYQYGQGVWAYVGGRWGDRAVTDTFVASGMLGVDAGFRRVLGMGVDEVFAAWHEATGDHFTPVLEERRHASEVGRPVLTTERTRANLNIAPSLSPDGRWVAFLSTRDLFSIDLYLANAETGEVRRRLVTASGDPHFDALRFIDSAGSWSPDGRRFAFVVFERGDNTIAILDVESGKVERRIEVSAVGAISNPSWSPDGRRIAFSGSRGGITDLYVLDIETTEVRQLTRDRFADLQPVWSPDGQQIAFVTDRGPGTDFDALVYDPMSIAIIDVSSGRVQVLPIFGGSKHINPQYSPDGRTLYFISDPEGVSDIYSYSLVDGAVRRLTHLKTGVAGITDMSPAISVASRSGRIMFSVFEEANYSIYAFDPDAIPSEQIAPGGTGAPAIAEVLPPAAPLADSAVERYLAAPRRGLPPATAEVVVTDYRPRLGLDFIGPPLIGVGTDQFGGIGFAGAVSAYFSDMLGRHQLGVAVQTGGSSSESFSEQIGAQVTYLNQTRRFNWGSILTHVPFVSERAVRQGETVIDGVPFVFVDVLREVATVDQAQLLTQYPLSLNRRWEAAGAFTRVDQRVEIQRFFLSGNRIVGRDVQNIADPPSLSYYTTSLAFVGDNSFFGFVSPVRGTRYRMEAGGNFGDIQFQTALADYRRYFFQRPLTFAVRGMHFGRYGQDAEDPRLSALFIGRETLVRGYDYGSFSVEECTRIPGSNRCPEFDRLVGSKLALMNLELRAPLFGTDQFGLFTVEFLPTEILAFVDGGVAWTEDESPTLKWDQNTIERVPVFSAGIGIRMLLGGYLPLHFYYAVPFQRPEESGVFGFAIAVGW